MFSHAVTGGDPLKHFNLFSGQTHSRSRKNKLSAVFRLANSSKAMLAALLASKWYVKICLQVLANEVLGVCP